MTAGFALVRPPRRDAGVRVRGVTESLVADFQVKEHGQTRRARFLAARLPERADEMKRRAIDWYEDCGRRAGSGDQSIDGFDPATNAKLRTLGYVD